MAGEFRAGQRNDDFLRLSSSRKVVVVQDALDDDARGFLLGDHRRESVHRRGGYVAVGDERGVNHVRTLLERRFRRELEEPVELLERHRLRDGYREGRVPVDVLAEEDALRPWLRGEVDLALLHLDLPRCGLARRASLGPDHLDREKVARNKQRLLGDTGEGERFQGDFDGGFHFS